MAENEEYYEKLVSEGDKNAELGNRELAAEYYESAYKIKKNGRLAFYIFVWYISQSDYETARDWLLELGSFSEYRNDFYTYALLLSNFVQLPDELIQELSNLEVGDIEISDKDFRFEDYDLNNRVRDAILYQNYRAAFSFANKIVKKGHIQPVEYVIYRLLKEKVFKEPKRLKRMIEEERFDDFHYYLNTKTNYEYKDEIARKLLNDIYDLLDGIVIEKNNIISKTFNAAIYNDDYNRALELCNNDIVLESLLKKAIELNQRNVVNRYKGDLGNYFYDTCEKIYEALKNKEYDYIKEIIIEYTGLTGKDIYNDYLIGMVDVYQIMPGYSSELINIMSNLTYGTKVIDTMYLKKIYGEFLNRKRYDAAGSLLHVFKCIGNQDDLNVEYLEFVLNRELYKNKGISYATQDEDDLLIARINEKINDQSGYSLIKTIEANNQHELFVIKYILRNERVSYFKIESEDYPIVFYIKKQKYSGYFKSGIVVTKISYFIEKGKYRDALKYIKNNFASSKEFDYELLSFAAYVCELMGKTELLEYIKSILLNAFDVSDYMSIINSDEIAILNNRTKYVGFVKKLINKPVE